MNNRYFFDANQELKRSDHLIYVSLKYTRTIDVINNIIDRLINAFDFIMDGILDKLKKEGKISSNITIPGLKCDKLKEVYADKNEFLDYIDFYLLLRKIRNTGHERIREFRRGVTMTGEVNGRRIDVTIDIITDYYKRTGLFMGYIEDNVDSFLEKED